MRGHYEHDNHKESIRIVWHWLRVNTGK